jgi:hypothetical protein
MGYLRAILSAGLVLSPLFAAYCLYREGWLLFPLFLAVAAVYNLWMVWTITKRVALVTPDLRRHKVLPPP